MTEEYVHILDSKGACSCGTFAYPVDDAGFTAAAAQHFRDTVEPVHSGGFMTGAGWSVVWTLVLVAAAAALLWAVTAL